MYLGYWQLLPDTLLAIMNIPGAMLLGGYTGVLLGTTSVPVWNRSQLLGGLFMSSAFGSGIAATTLASQLTGYMDHEESDKLATLGAVAGVTEGALLAGYVATSGEGRKHLFSGVAGKMMAGAVACLVAATVIEGASVVGQAQQGSRQRGECGRTGRRRALEVGSDESGTCVGGRPRGHACRHEPGEGSPGGGSRGDTPVTPAGGCSCTSFFSGEGETHPRPLPEGRVS